MKSGSISWLLADLAWVASSIALRQNSKQIATTLALGVMQWSIEWYMLMRTLHADCVVSEFVSEFVKYR